MERRPLRRRHFRAEAARAGAQTIQAAARLAAELSALSPDFARLRAENEVIRHGEGIKRIHHRQAGPIVPESTAFAVDGRPDLGMIVYNPQAACDAARIRLLLTPQAPLPDRRANPRSPRPFAVSTGRCQPMLTRTAIYEGTIHEGREDEFFARVRNELEPMWRRFPGVTAVRVQRTLSMDKDARPIAMILEMDFPDQAAIDRCMASSIRPQSHEATEKVMQLFTGRFYHYVTSATSLAPAP